MTSFHSRAYLHRPERLADRAVRHGVELSPWQRPDIELRQQARREGLTETLALVGVLILICAVIVGLAAADAVEIVRHGV